MRISAGFLVTGLSGKMRIQILPPRLTERVMARRAASIWRLVIQAGSCVARPYSPKATVWPPLATPDMRPRMTLRCLTRFGINIGSAPQPGLGRECGSLRPRRSGDDVAAVDPDLDADAAVGRVGVDLAVADVRAQRAERDATFRSHSRRAISEPPRRPATAILTPLAPAFMVRWMACFMAFLKAMRRLSWPAMFIATRYGVELGLADLLDLQLDLARGQRADLLAQDLHVRAALADDDARLGGVDGDRHVVDAALDLDAADAGVGQPADRSAGGC